MRAAWLILLPVFALLAQAADLVLLNGRVWTGDEKRPWTQAVAIRGHRIIGTGDDARIRLLTGKTTRVVNLGGRFAIPGFNDAHIHFLGGSLRLSQVDLTGSKSLEEIQARVAAFAKAHPCAPWILGSGWEYYVFPDGRLPARQDLDAVVKDRPVYLTAYDGHTAWANTAALRIAGVTRESKFEGYGEIVADPATGEPTGVLKEGAMALVSAKTPKPSREQKLDALERGLSLAASLGITSIQDAGGGEEQLDLYEELARRGKLTLRVTMAFGAGRETTQKDIERFAALKKKHGGPLLRAGAVKIMLDGVIETHTAAMLGSYADRPDTAGEPTMSQAELNKLVEMCDAARLQVYIHAIGDRAVRMALDACEHALKVNGPHDARFRIEHIETASSEDLPRFSRLGVLASMMPLHADPGTIKVWSRAAGPPRLPLAFAWRSLERAGARLVFSSDWPANISLDPIRGLHNAVNRRTTGGQPADGWIPEQRVSVETALRGYTTSAAFASFEETEKGQIKPGMLADLVVLSQDPFGIDPIRLHEIRVRMTIFDGKVVYTLSP